MNSDLGTTADALLRALSTSDLPEVEARCREDVMLFGTDENERWFNRADLLAALDARQTPGMWAQWRESPVQHGNWVAGTALYHLPGSADLPVRVTMVFEDGLLSHGHFSVAEEEAVAPPS